MTERTRKFWDLHPPDKVEDVKVGEYKLKSYVLGSEHEETVFIVNGGPGAACDYLRDSHSFLVDHGYRLIAYDQLGTGNSDRPEGRSDLWTIERYAAELEAVRVHFNLEGFHLLGHSWGGWLILEYLSSFSPNLKSLILESTCVDIPFFKSELTRLRMALGTEAVAMMQRHELQGTFDHPEYKAAITLLNYRHFCRLQEYPPPVLRTFASYNMEPYRTIQGENEFVFDGNMSDWQRIDTLAKVDAPVLLTVGYHDEITPACTRQMKSRLSNCEVALFEHSSHQPFYEEPALFQERLVSFLKRVNGVCS